MLDTNANITFIF